MPSVAIGILKVDKRNFGPDAKDRASEFSLAAQQSDALLKKENADIRVLIAPEYYWSGYCVIGEKVKQLGPKPLERADKHSIYKKLEKISKEAGSLVIVAGSIFYQKPGGKKVTAYNVCPVLQNGKFLIKSYKEMDDGSAGKNSPTFIHTSKTSAPYFKVVEVGFGIEVCGDHAEERLINWNATAGKTIDIQILISDSMLPLQHSVAARPGGYLVQCDIGGTEMGAAVYPVGPVYNKTTRVGGTVNLPQVNGATTHCFNLTI
ncbi:hypothetical protein [Paraburkholderia sp. D1E]|uniref:hypothetical protein n=1 Tax=Paraburkholderia sp. D1E TaxID=3461398 RepID=UPI0040464342